MNGARSEASAKRNARKISKCPEILAREPIVIRMTSAGTGLTHTNGIAGVNTSNINSSVYDIVTNGGTDFARSRFMNIYPEAEKAVNSAKRLAGL